MTRNLKRLVPFLFLTALAGGMAWLGPSAAGLLGSEPPRQAVQQKPAPTPSAPSDWKEVERLVGEDKYEAAAEVAARIREAARKRGDAEEWAHALSEETALRVGLHGYETAVRFLREQPWPDEPLQRAALDLVYARSLVTYVQAYSWEIRQRERVEAKGPVDLTAWTADQIAAEARRAFIEAWALRERLGALPVARLSRFVEANNYPAGVRGTARDALSYLFVELLADTSLWSPAESNDLFRLDFDSLLRGDPRSSSAIRLDDPAVHPLRALCAVLDDLEAWHAAEGHREAMLEARLERLRRLHASFSSKSRRTSVRSDLDRRLPSYRDLPWWAEGQATLASFVREEDTPDALVRARALAVEGHRAYPQSSGGQRCLSIQKAIEAPDYQLTSMTSDGLRRRSILVTHRGIEALHFRAYAVDLVRFIEAQRDARLLPAHQEIEKLVASGRPVTAWSEALPPTPDFRSHRTYVTPPLDSPGLHVIVASARPDFATSGNRLQAVDLVGGDLLLVTRQLGGGMEVSVVSGSTGEPVTGAEVALYRADWQKGHTRVAVATTPASGAVHFAETQDRRGYGYFLVARRAVDIAIDTSFAHFYADSRPGERTASLVYTDRSVYRPAQTIRFKVLAFHGGGEQARFSTLPAVKVTVTLVDPNNEAVETRELTTNGFGSASGEIAIPTGRLLGRWSVRSSLSGAASVRVEEYKRPTFEVSLSDPPEPLRLNRKAVLQGEARYYFGLPVASGDVRWRVVREPIYPWWWWHRGWLTPASADRAQTIATGTAKLEADGRFRLEFTPAADEGGGKEVTYRYAASADVTDEGGETRSASRAFRLGLVAVEASINAPAAFLRAGEPVEVQVQRSDLDGIGRAGKGAWRLVSLRQPDRALLPAEQPVAAPPEGAHRTPGDLLRPRWETGAPHEAVLRTWADGEEVARGPLEHDAQGRAALSLPKLPAGAYRIRYQTTDPFGARYETSKDLIVASDRTPLALPALLLAESGSVKVGGTARLLVHSGLAGQRLALEIWRGGRRVEHRELRPDRSLVLIPVGEKDRGGFGVTLTAVRDHQVMSSSQTVFVPWDDRDLKVELASFRDRLRPGTKEAWRVTVKGAAAEAGAAELLAYMYDRSLDVFEPHAPASPRSLLPTWTGVGQVRSNLGQSGPAWWRDDGFAPVPTAPILIGDRLKGYSGYGVGGLGRRDGLAFGAVGGAKGQRARMAPAPAARAALAMDKAEFSAMAERVDVASEEKKVAEPEAAEQSTPLRSDFSETAFWQPHLLTDRDGSAAIEFTVPDSVTSWKVWVHAVTRDLKAGELMREARSVKDLMVRPYVPRFLREGDEAELKVVVNNASERELEGELALDVIDPVTERSVAAEFALAAGSRTFQVQPGGGTDLVFKLRAPRRVGTVAVKVVARAGDVSDGELRPVPLLPGRVHLAQSRFVALKEGGRRTLSFPDMARTDDPSRIDEQLVVTVDGQLFLGVLQALPYLVDYPYECTEQTLNRFLSTGILSSLYGQYPAVARFAKDLSSRTTRLETWDAADSNRKLALEETPWFQESRGGVDAGTPLVNVLDPRIARATREAAFARLKKAQTAIGAFPWFPGGPPSPYMTLYVLHGFSKGLEFGIEVPKETVQRAWGYMHRHYVDQWAREAMAHECCWEWITFLNYVLSSYPDASWTGGVFTEADRKQMLDFSFKHWRAHSPYLKAYLSLTLQRAGRAADARLVFDSVMDSAKTDVDLGTYWAPEDRAWLWYNDTIETHAFALRTLAELSPKDGRRDGLVQWLFLNKKLNHWKSTRATAEVLYALAYYLRAEGALGVREAVTVTVGRREPARFVFEADAGAELKRQLLVSGDDLRPATDSTTVVEKEGKGLAFASATWHFSTDRMPEAGSGDLLSVERRFFRREDRAGGPALVPLEEGALLRPGDEVEVQLSLRARHAAEYVHLRDPRGAGFEPVSQVSRHRWDLGIAWYEEVRDSGSNFFFEQLPAGEYTFKHRIRVSMAGTFRVGPATVQSMYAPEFAAYSSGAVLKVASAQGR
jgi:alpha-2-macroglobulin